MYTLKGFAQINALIDNSITAVAPVGELSPFGWSFSREKTTHTSVDYQGKELIVFSSKEDNDTTPVDDLYTNAVLELIDWIYAQALAGRFSQNRDNFHTQFLAQFGTVLEVNDTGAMVTHKQMWFPASFDIKFTSEDFSDNRAKIWLADGPFVNEFDEFEIRTVPPLNDIDIFFNSYSQVRDAIAAITLPVTMEKVQAVIDGYPDTVTVSTTFEWIDRVNNNLKLNVDLTVVIWGAAGNNLDNIKEALIDYVLSNSTHTREEWEVVIPDLFTATEFIITPMWNHYSIPNRTLEAGLYSPVIPINDSIETVKLTCKGAGYTDEHILSVLQLAANTYKGISLSTVGGPKNRFGINQFNRQFPDYLAISSTHSDFMRMTAKTREFIIALTGMLRFAEELTDVSSIPREHTRTVREGVVYLSKTINNVQYLVVTKYSLNDPLVGIPSLLLDGDGYTLVDDESEPLI